MPATPEAACSALIRIAAPGAAALAGFSRHTRAAGAAEVVWNWGSNPHNVTFNSGPPHSETQTSGSFSRSFSEAGEFTHICTIHGRAVMSGSVTVA